MTYQADTTDKRSHRVGYFLALDGIPTRFGTHRFDELVAPTAATAHAWWKLDENGGATAADSIGAYNLIVTGTVPGAPSLLQPTTASTGSRYFTDDLAYVNVDSATVAAAVAERGSVSAGFRCNAITGSETLFGYGGLTSSSSSIENQIIVISRVGTELVIQWEYGSGNLVSSTTTGAGIEAGVPYHVMVTWLDTAGSVDLSVYLWQVGKGLAHEQTFTGLDPAEGGSAADITIGATRTGSTPPSPGTWEGYIEDVVLWKIHHPRDRALAYLTLASAPCIPAMDVSSIGISGSSLDRARSLIVPGGFSARVMDGETQREILSRRDGVRDELASSVTASATTIPTVASNNVAGRVVYLERETILLGNISTNDYITSQRGAWGSQPRAHGATLPISSRPRYLRGRRGVLWAVDLDTLNAKPLRAGLLSGSPQFAGGAYDLEFVDVQKELNRPLMRGFQEAVSAEWQVNGNQVDVTVPDARLFVDGTRSAIHATADGGLNRVHYLDSGDVNTSTNVVSLDLARIQYNAEPVVAVATGTELTLRQVQVIAQDPAIAALQVMCSILGDGANGTYDVLPGRAPGSDFAGVQVGAGIPDDWVDVAAWEGLEGIGGICVFYLDEETRLLDWLVNEISWRLGGYVYVTDEGKISFQRYRAAVPAIEQNTLAKADILAGDVSVVDDESETVGRISIECNYNPGQREYLSKQTVVFADLQGTYGDDLPAIELASKSLWLGGGGSTLSSPPSSQWELISSFDRIYSRVKEGVRKIRFRLPWRQHTTYVPGHTFRLTDDRLPDFAGDVGITSRTHEVTSASPDPTTGSVEVEAEEIPRGFVIAPTAIVASYNAGTGVITLDTTTDYHGSEPGFDFPVGANLAIYDASASPPFSVFTTAYSVSSTTGSTIATTAGASFAAGDLITLNYISGLSSTIPAVNTLADFGDHLYHVGSDDLIDADEGTKLA